MHLDLADIPYCPIDDLGHDMLVNCNVIFAVGASVGICVHVDLSKLQFLSFQIE